MQNKIETLKNSDSLMAILTWPIDLLLVYKYSCKSFSIANNSET